MIKQEKWLSVSLRKFKLTALKLMNITSHKRYFPAVHRKSQLSQTCDNRTRKDIESHEPNKALVKTVLNNLLWEKVGQMKSFGLIDKTSDF